MMQLRRRDKELEVQTAMLIESIVIKLIKKGAGKGPEYTLKIYGKGKIFFEGKENVKKIGESVSDINESKFLELLEEIKNTGFFQLEENYTTEGKEDRPITIISVVIPRENGRTVTKNAKFYSNDSNVPYQLKNIEKKIGEVINLDELVGKLPEIEKKKVEPVKIEATPKKIEVRKPPRMSKISIKYIAIIISLILVISTISYGVFSGIINFPSEDKVVSDTDDVKDQIPSEGSLEITALETASDVDFTTGEYTDEDLFFKQDIVYVYQEFKNFSTINDESCDLSIDLSVECNGVMYHENSTERTTIGLGIQLWWFPTTNSWVTGLYNLTITLEDNLSGNSTSKSTFFVLV